MRAGTIIVTTYCNLQAVVLFVVRPCIFKFEPETTDSEVGRYRFLISDARYDLGRNMWAENTDTEYVALTLRQLRGIPPLPAIK